MIPEPDIPWHDPNIDLESENRYADREREHERTEHLTDEETDTVSDFVERERSHNYEWDERHPL